MGLLDLERDLGSAVADWAKNRSLTPCDPLVFSTVPAHIVADAAVATPLGLARANRGNPMELAEGISQICKTVPGVHEARAVSPGFVNLNFSGEFLWGNLKDTLRAPESYGKSAAAPRKILIEFVSANPTGPLHLASGRGGALGDCLVRVLRRVGRQVHAECYVNDVGGQVERLGKSLLARRKNLPVPEDGYHGDYVADLARSFPSEADHWTAEEFARRGVEALLKTHQEDLDAFGVSFDRWFKESELHESGALKSALGSLEGRGMVYRKDGATWLGTSAEAEDDKDRVLVRQDGRPTYFLSDIAYHENKYSRGFAELVDILGADHHGYVPRMKAAIKALGHPPDSFRAIVHQLIHLFRGQEPVKMSKRSGEFVRLKELVDEVGKDACRFFFAMRGPEAHLRFDLELAKKKTSENPVYYCQYVHARVCSIFRAAADQGLEITGQPACSERLAAQERALLVKIAWFPHVLRSVERELSPHPLANYILELAGLFHPFYEHCRVIDPADPELSRSRLLLCRGVGAVIKEGLDLIGVSAPERM